MKDIEELSNALSEQERELIKKQQVLLLEKANTDEITGLPNRDSFFKVLQSKEFSTSGAILLSIVTDNISKLNALKGSKVTDILLQNIANRIQDYLPPKSVIGRMSSNQFLVCITPCERITDVQISEIVNGLKQKLHEVYLVEEKSYYLQFSLGISYRHPNEQVKSLFHHASLSDLAVLEQSGRIDEKIYMSHPYLHEEQKDLYEMEVALRQTIQEQGFNVMYQPIVNISNPSISLETLVRWKYKNNWISPLTFLPILEDIGLIKDLTLEVAEKCIADWHSWKKRLPGLSYIAINVSPSLFHKPSGNSFINLLVNLLRQYQLSPENICLEITENVLLEKETCRFIERCSKLGFLIAIDDFGTGYSSMSYLANYPFNILKIDCSFIKQVVSNPKQREVARAIVQLAQRLKLTVVAEGVETEDQLRIIQNMGVDAVQGYYFSKPQFFHEWNPSLLYKKRDWL